MMEGDAKWDRWDGPLFTDEQLEKLAESAHIHASGLARALIAERARTRDRHGHLERRVAALETQARRHGILATAKEGPPPQLGHSINFGKGTMAPHQLDALLHIVVAARCDSSFATRFTLRSAELGTERATATLTLDTENPAVAEHAIRMVANAAGKLGGT